MIASCPVALVTDPGERIRPVVEAPAPTRAALQRHRSVRVLTEPRLPTNAPWPDPTPPIPVYAGQTPGVALT